MTLISTIDNIITFSTHYIQFLDTATGNIILEREYKGESIEQVSFNDEEKKIYLMTDMNLYCYGKNGHTNIDELWKSEGMFRQGAIFDFAKDYEHNIDMLVVNSPSGCLYAYDRANGKILWKTNNHYQGRSEVR